MDYARIQFGQGFDAHRFDEERTLILGGVQLPGPGLAGHSDADVLTHAIIDALLGAAALGDIGSYFPPGEPQYKDISSLALLKRVTNELTENGWLIDNVDATIVAEQPRLREFIDGMRQQLSQTLDIAVSQVSVKASTSARLGFTGRGEGIAADAIALLEESER